MIVGYSLGNRNDQETDIKVVGEDDPNVVTYSRALSVSLSRMCRNNCPYCGFHKRDNLTVPYSTIKLAKHARANGAREVLYIAGERPDKFSHIRAQLELWGFSSYLDYIYTVCELGFLEGLIPVIDIGFLTPKELKRMTEITAVAKIMLDSVDANQFPKVYSESPGKARDIRLRSLEWAGKLKLPVSTGIMVGIGDNKEHRKDTLNAIASLHKSYGHVHEVVIQNFLPEPGTAFKDRKPPSKEDMLKVVDMALSILPSDVSVTVPLELNPDIEDFLRAGIRDLGRIYEKPQIMFPNHPSPSIDSVFEVTQKLGLDLQQRFPLKKNFIKEGLYSKKLGQVFDAYRYKIKKDGVDKGKDVK
ncbi:MAG: 7,8-didemethyl-8-hydroxy-5-deazariboflavin synthase subunit CofG [Candidatus Margulisiibacteriota bacterium]